MPIIEIAQIQLRRGQEYQTGVPQLQPGEMAWAEDTENLYIGKRIVEGASNDKNSRILTDKDLNTIFQIAQASVASANSSTAYRYRADIPYGNQPGQLLSTTSTYANKLNNWVSLTDFNPVWPPFGTNDITAILQNAIGIVASNNTGGGVVFPGSGVGPVPIKIPAGNWAVSSTVALPPFTTLIGDGMGMTVLTYSGAANNSNAMFQTVDSNGRSYTENMSVDNGQNARFVRLSNMTLQFPRNFTTGSQSTLVSLDNIQDVYIENVYLGTTSTSVLTGIGTGIRIRTSGIPPTDYTMIPSGNINIHRCIFNGITLAADVQGLANRCTIKDNKFTWLETAIKSDNYLLNTSPAAINSLIDSNKFENIKNEAIVIGLSYNNPRSNITSSNNSFRNVGCEYAGDGFQAYPVITVNQLGFQSVNDYFDRQWYTPVDLPVDMIHWVSGKATISNGATSSVSVLSSGTTNITKIPLSNYNQMVTINYTLSNNLMQRTGQLNINISTAVDGGNASVSDSYNFIEYTANTSNLWNFSTDTKRSNIGPGFLNYCVLTCSGNFNNTLITTLDYNINFLN
jgi:hypothetical protein